MSIRRSKHSSVERRSQRRQKIGYLSFRSRIILNEVKDLTLGLGLHKLNRLTHDRGRGRRFARDDTGSC